MYHIYDTRELWWLTIFYSFILYYLYLFYFGLKTGWFPYSVKNVNLTVCRQVYFCFYLYTFEHLVLYCKTLNLGSETVALAPDDVKTQLRIFGPVILDPVHIGLHLCRWDRYLSVAGWAHGTVTTISSHPARGHYISGVLLVYLEHFYPTSFNLIPYILYYVLKIMI